MPNAQEKTVIPLVWFGGLDIFGVGSIGGGGNADPWVAFQYTFENALDEPVFYSARLGMPIAPIGGQIFHRTVLNILVFDSDGSGDGTFRLGRSQATAEYFDIDFNTNRSNVIDANAILPGSGLFPTASSAGGRTTVFDLQGDFDLGAALVADDAEFADELFFIVSGVSSAGDSFVIDGFTCLAASSDRCPERPIFQTVIPIPAPLWLFGSALGLLGWVRRRAAGPANWSASNRLNPDHFSTATSCR